MSTAEAYYSHKLPANEDAERSLLGAILLDNHAYNQVAESLRSEDFFLDSHRRIFQCITEMMETNRPVDIITLREELSKKKQVEAIGGVAYLASLTEGLPRLANVEHYVRIIKDKALLRALITTCENVKSRAYDQSEEPTEVLDAAETAMFQLADRRVTRGFHTISDIVKNSFRSIDELYERGQRITGVETFYEGLDEKTSGLQPSDLIIIAARPSMGKTAFAINIAENVAVKSHKTVAIFSLEMSEESLLMRMLSSQAMVDAKKLRTGFLPKEDRGKLVNALATLIEAPIYIDDTPGISINEMRAKARRLKQSAGKLDLVVVDYLQLVSGGAAKKFENRTQEVSAVSRGLKALAKELKCPVVALSQLSRAPETRGKGDQRPQLSDLRESGSIEQDADVVMFIFREEYYRKPDDIPPELEGVAEIIISKQRNGPTGLIKLAFIKQSTRFENLAEGGPAPDGQYY